MNIAIAAAGRVAPQETPPAESGARGYVPLEEYGVIGNCRTAALVSLDGSIDWLCLPHFSGASVFAALLDSKRGGRFAVRPRDVLAAERRYIEDTNVLETVFRCRNGIVRLTDFMTVTPESDSAAAPQPQHEIVRLIECTSGEVACDVVYQPRPGNARGAARVVKCGRLGWTWTHRGLAAYLHSDFELGPAHDGEVDGAFTLHAGETRHAVLSVCENEAVVIHPLGAETRRRLDETVRWWKQWAARCRYQGPYRGAVVRSALALKLLTYSLSGAMVAAPTTSLPEKKSGTGNWDYRYCWLRDSAMVLMSFIELGYEWEGTAFLEWLLHATKLTQPRLQVLYDIFGETSLTERELPHFEGYRGLGPVRVGNAAHEQQQNDIYGEVILSADEFVLRGGQLGKPEKKLVAGFGRVVRSIWREPDQGIWEVRTKPRHNTHSKLMCWVALDRLARLRGRIGLDVNEAELRGECQRIREDIEAHGFSAAVQSYVGYYGGSEPDASLLLMARNEYVAHDHPRMQSTYRYIEKELAVDGFLYRYPPGGEYEGLAEPENLFGACAFWRVEYLAGLGRLEEAVHCFERLVAAATPLGLYAEEFDATTRKPVGNFPQAFTHVGLIRAALAIEAASQRT